MARIAHYSLSMYGIKMNDGTWMKCFNGEDWCHFLEIVTEGFNQGVVDNTTPLPAFSPVYRTPTDHEMHRYRSNNARHERSRRSYVKNSKSGHNVKY